MFEYLIIDGIFLLLWIILFFHRIDLRKEMVISSLVILPTTIFDYLSQPSYYHPQTFLSIPVGIEGPIFGFCIGGIGAVLYEELSQKHLRKIRERIEVKNKHWLVPLSVLIISLGTFFIFKINIMITLLSGLLIGALLIVRMRDDLKSAVLFSGVYFGLLYFLVVFVWLQMFPYALSYWNLEVFGNIIVLGVPLGEVLFGFLYGAFWGPVYEFLLGYKLVKIPKRSS